jgi:hypothetical protein
VVGGGVAAIVLDPMIGLVEQERDFMRVQTRNPGQVPVGEGKRRCH